MLFGYPSALARIARHARERGLAMDDLGIRVAISTSEVLQPEWRTLIAATFGCGVANEYGARDAGFIARECPLGGLHITAEELIVEVVDEAGEPVADGVEGDILVTNLAGPEFPFIRYRTGDRGVLAGHDCPCGRSLPLLAAISGRANDGLIDQQGRWIHGSAINHVVRELDGLLAYRVVQESRDAVDIALVLERPLAADSAHRLERHVRRLLGAEVRVGIAQVDAIPAEANGKFRHVVCRVAQPGMPAASMEAAR
jgi:phenylacetate-CoA ligase